MPRLKLGAHPCVRCGATIPAGGRCPYCRAKKQMGAYHRKVEAAAAGDLEARQWVENRRRSAREWSQRNRGKVSAYVQAYRLRHPEKTHAVQLRRYYGMTLEDFKALLDRQGGVCAICRRPSGGTRNGHLHVDHDHVTGKIRGLLCNECNVGIGRLNDDPELLRRALAYLTREA